MIERLHRRGEMAVTMLAKVRHLAGYLAGGVVLPWILSTGAQRVILSSSGRLVSNWMIGPVRFSGLRSLDRQAEEKCPIQSLHGASSFWASA